MKDNEAAKRRNFKRFIRQYLPTMKSADLSELTTDMLERLYETAKNVGGFAKEQPKLGLKTMSVAEAYTKARTAGCLRFGSDDHEFVTLGWQNPYTGGLQGPLIIAVTHGVAIEVKMDGTFVNVFPATTKHYTPFLQKLRETEKG